MSTITRTWIAFAAIGTGLIHGALVIGAPLGLAIPPCSPRYRGVRLGCARVNPRHTARSPRRDGSCGCALGRCQHLPTFVAGTLSLHARRTREGCHVARTTPSAVRYLTALMAGGLVVSALTTPALAATEAGSYAQPHGEHDGSFTPQRDAPDGDNVDDLFTIPGHNGH